METNEPEIIYRILSGEKELFRYLVRAYDSMVFSLAADITDDSDTAADVTQEAFIKAYDHLSRYDPSKGRFSTWLVTIAYNLAISQQRLRRRRPPTQSLDETEIDTMDDKAADSLPGSTDESDTQRLAEAIDELQPEEKLVLTLFYDQDLSLAEIAEITGTLPGTVATRLSRIRKKLYTMIKRKRQ